MSRKVQPNVSHLDRRQPSEVEVTSPADVDALARVGIAMSRCRYTQSGVCLNSANKCLCGIPSDRRRKLGDAAP
jgi:hypothetical protein